MDSLLEYPESAARRCPHKTAFTDGAGTMTYREVWDQARAVGSYLLERQAAGKVVAVLMEPSPRALTAMLGVLCGGGICAVVDPQSPRKALAARLMALEPAVILCHGKTARLVRPEGQERVLDYAQAAFGVIREDLLGAQREAQLPLDPVFLTEGCILSHRNLLTRVEDLCPAAGFTEETVFGSRGDLEKGDLLTELFSCLKLGAMIHLLPQSLTGLPVQLVEYLNRNEINTLFWDANAMETLSSPGTFGKIRPRFLRTVAFTGGNLSIRELNRWRRAVPGARMLRLWGDALTGPCCYQEVRTQAAGDQPLPLGRPLPHTQALLLDDGGHPAEEGRLFLRGDGLGRYWPPREDVFQPDPRPFHEDPLLYADCHARWNKQGELIPMPAEPVQPALAYRKSPLV